MTDDKPRKTRKKAKKVALEPVNPNASRAMFVVNPIARGGAVAKISGELHKTLGELGLDFDLKFTEYHEHGIEIARDAAEKGYGMVVAVGGDGTVYEVVNGLMSVDRDRRPKLGVVPVGRGSDFCRTVGIPRDWLTACALLVSGRKRTIDVGRMEYMSQDGARASYFANIAGLGFDGESTERANNMPLVVFRVVGGKGAYLLGLFLTYASCSEKDVELHVDDKAYRVLAIACIIANCKYFGGKMRIAPDALCDDGLFDVIILGAGFGNPMIDGPTGVPAPRRSMIEKGVAKARLAKNVLPRIYGGNHILDESVRVLHGSTVKIISPDRMILQADGEVVGHAPFTAEIIKGALDVIA